MRAMNRVTSLKTCCSQNVWTLIPAGCKSGAKALELLPLLGGRRGDTLGEPPPSESELYGERLGLGRNRGVVSASSSPRSLVLRGTDGSSIIIGSDALVVRRGRVVE